MVDRIWEFELGEGPLVASAIHDGHEVRPEVLQHMKIEDLARLREEDPFTGIWATVAPTCVVGLRSRFEVDLNRPRDKSVYRIPEDCWGLEVWKDSLPDDIAQRSLDQYDLFYQELGRLYRELAQEHGAFVVFDLHTYNHRRDGSDGPEADPEANPQVNLGTATIGNPKKFAPLVARFVKDLSGYPFPSGNLDVRENVKFKGGEHAKWAHQKFPENACVIAIEFKKFFMDEWSGQEDSAQVEALRVALASTVPGVLEELEKLKPKAV